MAGLMRALEALLPDRPLALPKRLRRRVYLADTHGWVCHLCGLPIPLECTREIDHPWGLTADHVIPRALAGRDALVNQRPAHRYCNQLRGTHSGLTPGQVLLVRMKWKLERGDG